MLLAGTVVEGLMALSVTVEDKEWVIGIPGDGMDIAGSDVNGADAVPMADVRSGVERGEVADVVVVGEVLTAGLGGNVLLDNERMDVRDGYAHPRP